MQQRQKLRYDTFDLIGDKHLVAVELYLVALQVDI